MMALKKKDTARAISIRENERQAKKLNELMQERYIVEELERENDSLKKTLLELEIELEGYKSATVISNIDDPTVIKRILSYYAKGYIYKVIIDKMRYTGFDGTIADIETICKNMEDLDSEFILHYKKERKAYEKQIQMNPDILKDRLVMMYDELINSASMDLDNVKEVEERRKIREEIAKHGKEISALIRTIQDGEQTSQQSEILSKMANRLSNTLTDDKNTNIETVLSNDMLVM